MHKRRRLGERRRWRRRDGILEHLAAMFEVRRALASFIDAGVVAHDPSDDTYTLVRCGHIREETESATIFCTRERRHRGRCGAWRAGSNTAPLRPFTLLVAGS